ncbi:MAG: hypothetical protein V1867_06440 [Candidatus Falkowbacteria bacterium]
MEDNIKTINSGRELFGWKVDEFVKHDRSRSWYAKAIIIAFLMLLFSFLTSNFLFAIIIIIFTLIIILHHDREPEKVRVSVTDQGIIIGQRFYDYDEMRNFAIVYKPGQDIKNLYFEFKSVVRQRLSIPLESENPLPIRENLLKYLPEDKERTDIPLSELLSKIFKL